MANKDDFITTHDRTPTRSHHVYLLCRGLDKFKSDLSDALRQNNINTFMDHGELKNSTGPEELERSRIAIVVFSRNFMSSSYRRDQVANILECQEKKNLQVLPIYYDVQPSDVYRIDKQSFPMHASDEKIQQWMSTWSRLPSQWQILTRFNDSYLKSKNIPKIVKWVTRALSGRSNIFLSFRKICTLRPFIDCFRDALKWEGFQIHTHDQDEDMDRPISPSVVEAIEKSWLSIVVLSESYVYSSLCMEELVKILDRKKNEQLVFPIFYVVEVEEIRHQTHSFGVAMAEHEKIRGSMEVEKWRLVLTLVSDLPGWFIKIGNKQEHDHFISSIVKQVCNVSIREKGDWSFTEEHQQNLSISETGDRSSTEEHQPKKPWRDEVICHSNEQYQIFLSFRGADTRYSFTDFLYKALRDEGFKVFMDNWELHKGDTVEVITEAIENSMLSIIVFSQDFAESTRCLNEVVKILECKVKKKQTVLPIFYKVEPSDVRHQQNNYEKAMAKHEIMFGKDSEVVRKWKYALYEVSYLNAFQYKNNSGEYELDIISDTVKHAYKVLISDKGDRSLTGKHQQNVSISEKGDWSFTEEHQQNLSISETGDQSSTEEHQQKKPWRYDVFLSFEGSDTRESFTGYLYHALCQDGFKAFANEEAYEKGRDKAMVMETIRESIEKSRILIVVLSKNYAYCLKELAMIIDSQNRNGQQIFVIYYYGVDQSNVKDICGSYGDAMAALIKKSITFDVELRDKDQLDHDIESIVQEASKHLPCYDVFLSFNNNVLNDGPFVGFLQNALDMKGFTTSTKDKKSKPSVTEKIEKSRLSIIIFSQNYVHSSSCLDELVIITSSMNVKRQPVWPIFYKMNPSDLKKSFEKAMIEHDKVEGWRSAISDAAKLVSPQWHLQFGDEYEIIEEIVEKVIKM